MRLAALLLVLVGCSCAFANPPTAIEVTLGSQTLLGRPLAWTPERIFLLSRDGRLWDFAPREMKDYRAAKEDFRALTTNELRAQLQREFGGAFDVTSTGNYLVVHPAGEENQWAQRFEQLYRSFIHYFQARGYRPHAPHFPLVAVVFKRQEDYLRYSAQQGDRVSPQVLGHYSPTTNRIAMYDTSGSGATASGDWTLNAETIIHEAAHQTAFNTGVHNRWSMPPRWVAEGLGTMFEARGVYDASHFTSRQDRLNRGRLEAFQRHVAAGRKKGTLAALVGSDRLFQENPDAAYAEAWALSFFLAETEPRKYFAYLQKTASHAPFVEVKGPERIRDFTSVFGEQLDLLEAKMLRFMAELK